MKVKIVNAPGCVDCFEAELVFDVSHSDGREFSVVKYFDADVDTEETIDIFLSKYVEKMV